MDPILGSGMITYSSRSQYSQMMDVISRIRASLDVTTVFNTTVSEARRILGLDRVLIYQFDDHYNGTSVAESVKAGWTPSLGVEIQDTCFRESRAEHYNGKDRVNLIPDVSQADLSPCHLALLERFEVKANLVVPIFEGSRVWGLLIANQCSGPRQWQDLEVATLMQMATQLSIAIQQTEAIRIEKELEVERQALADREQLLQLISKIPRPLTVEETLQTTATELRQALQADRVVIYRFRPDWSGEFVAESVLPGWGSLLERQEWDPILQSTMSDCNVQKLSHYADTPLRNSLIEAGEHTNVFRTVEDIYAAGLSDCYVEMLERFQARAYLIVTITFESKAWGLLAVYQNAGPRRWKQSEINLTYQVATQLTVALQHLTLHERDQARINELEEFHQLKDDFLSTVSHELRTPLTSMRMAIEMLKQTAASEMVSVERLNRYIGMLESECRREINLVEDLLNLQRLAANPDPVNLDEIDLDAALKLCAQTFAIRAHDYKVKLRYAAEAQLPTLKTEATGLDRILQELLNNACKYTEPGGEILISATPLTQQAIPGLQISIGNTGEIPAQELPRIFDKFYRVPMGDPRHRGGTGLGLSLVKALVEALHGQIAVTSAAHWTAFEIWLPLRSPLALEEGS